MSVPTTMSRPTHAATFPPSRACSSTSNDNVWEIREHLKREILTRSSHKSCKGIWGIQVIVYYAFYFSIFLVTYFFYSIKRNVNFFIYLVIFSIINYK